MKRCLQIIILITLAFFYHCAPRPIETPSVWMDEGQRMFEAAERYFQNKNYQNALEIFLTFLQKYPEHQLAPAAFLKIGDIYCRTKQRQKAGKAQLDYHHGRYGYGD